MDPTAAILKLKPELADRLRDAEAWQAVRDDPNCRIAGLALDIRCYLIDPLFKDLRRGPYEPASRRLIMVQWLARYDGQHRISTAKLLADYPLLRIAPGDRIWIRADQNHIAFHTANRLTIYGYNSNTAEPLNLLRVIDGGHWVHYLGAGRYRVGKSMAITSKSKFHDASGPITIPLSTILKEVSYLAPMRILPCGLLQASHGSNSYLVNLETGDYERITSGYHIGDDFGGRVGYCISHDNLSSYFMLVELM